jgi:hypothetical protein
LEAGREREAAPASVKAGRQYLDRQPEPPFCTHLYIRVNTHNGLIRELTAHRISAVIIHAQPIVAAEPFLAVRAVQR